MKNTKKSKILSLLLCGAMILSTFAFLPAKVDAKSVKSKDSTENQAVNYTKVAPFLPAVKGKTTKKSAKAASLKKAAVQTQSNDSNPENSLQTNKTVSELDEDGNATLTLEAYATGASVISTISEEVPTDIILVLDQSGSMKDNMASYTYTKISTKTNSNYYNQWDNLYYKDGDSYVKVSVKRASVGTGEYTYKEPESGSDWWGSYTGYENSRLYDNGDQLCIKIGDNQYKEVTVTRSGSIFNRTYIYSVDGMDSETSSGNNTEKREFNGYPFFIRTEKTDNQYTYDYTTSDGNQSITSVGANEDPASNDENAFYTRVNSGSEQKLAALKTAVENFTDSVYAKAKGADGKPGTDDDINHRIAVVGFANSTAGNYNYSNTELFIGSREYIYGTSASNKYGEAFQNMNTEAGHDNVIDSKDALTASGATYIDLGIEMANEIFNANPISSTNDTKRNRVVVVFTDGAPGYDGKWNNKSYGQSGDAEAVANAAIKNAKDTKNTYGATVYTIGIFKDANPNDTTDNSNKFMNYVSSNYKNAESMTNPGESTKPADSGYYLSANNAGDLNDIFQKISQEIQTGGTSVTLDKTSVVKDVISDYFELPKNEDGSSINASDIEVYTADCTGKNNDTGEYTFADKKIYKDAKVLLDGKTISVTNFDFADNWVGTVTQGEKIDYRGKKLIIEIPIKVRDGFWGGNKVITNGAGSGVFENRGAEESVEDFTSPTLDVPINVPDFTANDKTIYYGSNVAADGLFNKVTLPESEAWKAAYVNATYSSPGSISNTDCGTYNATLTLTPKYEGTQTAESKTATSNVHVLVPQVEYNDSEIYLGENADYKDNIPSDNVKWVDIKDHADISDVTGTAPELSFEYSPAADAFEQDTPVNATVKVGDKDITNVVIFKNGENKHKGTADKEEFTVKVKTCELTITKIGHEDVDENQSFVFHVKGDGSNRYSQNVDVDVVIHRNGSTVVKNLPIGNYTVTEDQGWSWRYTPTEESKDGRITLTKKSPSGVWTFDNTRQEKNWLNGSSWCKNIFKDGEIEQSRTTTTKN